MKITTWLVVALIVILVIALAITNIPAVRRSTLPVYIRPGKRRRRRKAIKARSELDKWCWEGSGVGSPPCP